MKLLEAHGMYVYVCVRVCVWIKNQGDASRGPWYAYVCVCVRVCGYEAKVKLLEAHCMYVLCKCLCA